MSTSDKKENRLGEIVKFLVSGGICWVVQTVFLALLRDGLGMDTLIALAIAFLLATVANYLLAVLWIWPSAKGSGSAVRLGFLITSLIGLFLNELLMWIFRIVFGEDRILFFVFGAVFNPICESVCCWSCWGCFGPNEQLGNPTCQSDREEEEKIPRCGGDGSTPEETPLDRVE